jgi:inner membrane protein
MDPISQATLGSQASQSFARKSEMKWALLIGALSGLAPDLDILIKSSIDPMVFFEYHRQFTHSLIFIPIGALVVSLVLHLFLSKKISFARNYFFSFLGYGTHGLLDACTSYGTQLFWPFSSYRVAWNNISIVDPLFTIPLFIFCVLGLWKKSTHFTRVGLVYAFCYLGLGVVQNYRASEIGKEIAMKRGHTPKKLVAKPTLGNLILWKNIYEYDGYFYTDAVRLGTKTKIIEGAKIKKLDIARDFPWIKQDSQHFQDIQKFAWFSDEFLALHPDDPLVIGDVRYSLSPDSIYPLWGIKVIEGMDRQHVIRENFNGRSLQQRQQFMNLLFN